MHEHGCVYVFEWSSLSHRNLDYEVIMQNEQQTMEENNLVAAIVILE